MSESAQTQSETTHSSIHEAFVQPIRNLTLIDDDYPTLDELLSPPSQEYLESKKTHLEKLREFRAFCKSDECNWSMEILNKAPIPPEPKNSTAVNFSDLIILDYHLNPDDQTDNKSAVNFLRGVTKHDYFNIVVVYTRAAVDFSSAKRVAADLGVALLTESWAIEGRSEKFHEAKELLKNIEDEIEFDIDRFARELSSFGYLRIRMTKSLKEARQRFSETKELASAIGDFEAAITEKKQAEKDAIKDAIAVYAMEKWSERFRSDKNAFCPNGLASIAIDANETHNWIWAGNTLITVLPKEKVSPSEILKILKETLAFWSPLPQRILYSKLHSEISHAGGRIENDILSDSDLQAGWLQEFIDGHTKPDSDYISKILARTWDALSSKMQPSIKIFASKIGPISSASHNFEGATWLPNKSDLNSAFKINAFASCKQQIDREHLEIGHILKRLDTESAEYWLCLTPTCDLQPGRSKGKNEIGCEVRIPFNAIKLHEHDTKKSLKDAENGNHIFIIDLSSGKSIASSYFKNDGNPKDSPTWRRYFAENNGILSSDCRFEASTITASIVEENNQLNVSIHKFQVVAQLRYEYALHLLQKLTGNLSRIGLDFKKYNAK